MTDVNYNNKTSTLEVSVRIFTDDFEKTLKKTCNCKVDLIAPADIKSVNSLVDNYISKHVRIIIDGKLQQLQFKGFQKEEESTWSYFEIKGVSSLKKLDIENDLLHDYKEEQINMIHVKAQGKDVTDKLDFPKSKFGINF